MNDVTSKTGRTYWQSFEHLADSPEVAEILDKEFATYDPDVIRSLSRRKFLKYAAASMALAGVGLSGCRRWPVEAIAPYAHQPHNHIPGVPIYYATSWELGGVGSGLLAESFDGRPIKLEGNPSHPHNRTRSYDPDDKPSPDMPSRGWGSADAIEQAQVLTLYDPERSRSVVDRRRGGPVARDMAFFESDVLPQLRDALAAGRLAVLAGATASPTYLRLLKLLPAGSWYTYEPLRVDNGGTRTLYHLDRASVVLGLDDDYLGTHPAHTRHAADWAALRASADDASGPVMSRCYQAECRFSITGANADVRLPVRPTLLEAVARLVTRRLGISTPAPSFGPLHEGELERMEAFADAAAADLREAGANALVAAGPNATPAVRQLADAMNAALGSEGTTLTHIADPVEVGGHIRDLALRMRRGEVDALVMLGGNPAYDAPADVDFAALLAEVPTSVHLSAYLDETGLASRFHVPMAHFLEAWGDTRGWDGSYAPQQPLILPLFSGVSPIQLLGRVLGLDVGDGLALVRDTFRDVAGVDDAALEAAFREFLHDGVLFGSAAEAVSAPDAATTPGGDVAVPGEAGTFEIVFEASPSLYDGRFANNGWLQETPDPLTKLCWDNAAMLNARDARDLGIRTNDVVTVTVGGRSLDIAAYVNPGQPRGTIGLPLGYGRRAGGSLAVTRADAATTGGGFDTYRLRTSDTPTYASGATLARIRGRYLLAMTQNHYLIDDTGFKGREKRIGKKGADGKIIRETTFDLHADHLRGGARGLHPTKKKYNYGGITLQIFEPPSQFNYPHAWGMSVDMSACIGCNACVVACQSENNIPVVGKESVLNNREMSWLRVDAYFKAEGRDIEEQKLTDNPDVVWQPMMCVHCENAPCEQVCPVAATVHDTEGLNTMVYNRCIGTRYCSNNCPYKVRRFNYLDYHYKPAKGSTLSATFVGIPDQQQQQIDLVRRMVFNPDVTLRMRGVMEKCTYCTQRIQDYTIYRKNRGEAVMDGDIKTACQQACPTEAIVFGNLNDQTARVTAEHQNPRAYGVLDDLNTRPRTKYLAKLRQRPAVKKATDA